MNTLSDMNLPKNLRTDAMLVNMGPQHPATHGVLRVVLALKGERIAKATVEVEF